MRRALPLLGLVLAGCHTDLWIQPKVNTMDPSAVLSNGPPLPPEGTVSVAPRFTAPTPTFPVAETERTLHIDGLAGVLARGRERFDIFCSPCHGRLADGNGMIAQRGLALTRQPRNLHLDRLQKATDGYLFSVITHGYGAMMPYDDRIPPRRPLGHRRLRPRAPTERGRDGWVGGSSCRG